MNFALGHAGVGVLPRARPVRRPTSIRNGESGWTIRAPTLDIPGLNWLNDLLVHKLEWTGEVAHLPKIDFSLLQEQILLFLAVFGLLTLVIHALQRSASGRAMLAVRSSEVAAEASGIAVNRSKILIFALSAAIAGFGGAMLGMFSFQFTNASAPLLAGLIWLALAVTFGVRRPGGALLAGFAFAAGTAVFHWISSWSFLRGGDVQALITSVYFVPILSGLGAIQLAQEPDGILSLAGQQKLRQEAREGAPGPHRRGRGRGARRRGPRARATPRTEDVGGARRARRDHGRQVALERADDATFAMRGIVAGYGDAEVLHGVDLRARRAARSTALLGANGAGKSTLCSVAAGMVDASLGTGVPRGQGHHRRRVVPARARRRAPRPRGPGHLPRPHRRGEPHRAAARRRRCATRPTSASRSWRSGASRSPACSRAASSRC